MKRFFSFLAPVLLVTMIVGCSTEAPVEPSAGAPLAKTTVTMLDGGGIFENPCNGEIVEFTGKVKITSGVTLNGNGSGGGSSHLNISYPNWKGTGSYGNDYRYPGATNHTLNLPSSGTVTHTLVDRQQMIVTGPDGRTSTFTLKVTIRLTINANGEVVVDSVSFEFECGNGNESTPL